MFPYRQIDFCQVGTIYDLVTYSFGVVWWQEELESKGSKVATAKLKLQQQLR